MARPVALQSVALRFATWIVGRTPLRISYLLAWVAGQAVFWVWFGGRRRCIANMRRVSGGDRALARRYARRSFAYYALYVIDFLRMGRVTAAEVRDRVEYDGWALIEEARSGSGMVFVAMHFGNWDFGAARIAGHGIPLSGIADTFTDASLDDLVVGTRERLGVQVIPAGRLATGVFRALRRNEVVAMLLDVPSSDVEVEFFGEVIAVPAGPARIALRTGASVVTGMLPRSGPRSPRFEPVIERVQFAPSGDVERDVRELTQAMLASMEETVRRYPEQWYIFRRLWVADRDVEAVG
jgi:lauroyl/myristoyl acyltransferase